MTIKILFVCTGNICRSSTAEAVARHKAEEKNLAQKFIFDSAGTTKYHQGEASDRRAVATAKERGILFGDITSRQINDEDFANFDYIFCMDRSHLSNLYSRAKLQYHDKIHLFLQFCALNNFWDDEVVDPYYGSEKGFDEVFDVLDEALENMFEILRDD